MPPTDPSSWSMSVHEDEVLPFDPTPLLGLGQSVASPSSYLVNLDTQTPITLANGPVLVGGNGIEQRVVGGTDVAVAGNYLLIVTFNASPSTNVRAMELDLTVTP